MQVMTSPAGPVAITRHEAPDSRWELARRSPHPGLVSHVAGYCGYVEETTQPLRRRETPTGQVTMILSFGDPIDVVHMSSSPDPTPGRVTSFVAGLHEGYALVDNRGRQSGIQLDLTPLGAHRLLGVPMDEVANQVIPLDALRGSSVDELTERLATAPTWGDGFALLDELLLHWLDDGPEPDPAVHWAWRQLDGSGGRVPVGLLAEEIGWSRRHFTRRFSQQVGLAPKATARVLRFQRAFTQLRQGRPGTTIADVAAVCGYADHSHLDREFRRLAGRTPSELLADQLPADGGIAG